jgi:hypothetical protein
MARLERVSLFGNSYWPCHLLLRFCLATSVDLAIPVVRQKMSNSTSLIASVFFRAQNGVVRTKRK